MNLGLLYFLLLKATFTSFSGVSSLPVVRDELILKRGVLTDFQLNAAVVVGRTTPGPSGLYLISVGYFVRGVPGAIVAWLAMVTPAMVIIAVSSYLGRKVDRPRVRGILHAVVIASAGLTIAATIPLARDVIVSIFPLLIAVASCTVLVLAPRLATVWVIAGSAFLALTASFFHVL